MHTQRDSMYVVWMSRGNGIAPGAKFRRIEDALRYVDERRNTASFAIRMPDGMWYRDVDTARLIFPQLHARRSAA